MDSHQGILILLTSLPLTNSFTFDGCGFLFYNFYIIWFLKTLNRVGLNAGKFRIVAVSSKIGHLSFDLGNYLVLSFKQVLGEANVS